MVIPKKYLLISSLVVAVAVLGYFFVLKKGPSGPSGNASGSTAGAPGAVSGQPPQETVEAAPLAVKAIPVRRGELVIKLKSPGEAYTDKKIALKAEAGGAVKNLLASEGRHVKEGDVLLELDDREYRLSLERTDALRLKYLSDLFLEKQFAEADKETTPAALDKLNKAESEYKKSAEAFQKGLISQDAFEQAQKDYEIALIEAGRKRNEIMASAKGLTQAEIDVKIARMQLAKTIIRAPFDGIITDLKISPREHVDAGRELFTLVNISRIRIQAKVLESEIGKMSVGREVDLRFSAYPGKVFKGFVEAISPVVNADDKTCAVHIAVNNPGEQLKPGMHAEVEIAAEIHQGKILVPQEAILVRGGRKLLFVVEDGLAKWRYVQVGLENEEFAEILPAERPEDTVKEGELVIIEGHFTLAHDTRVAVNK